MSGVWVFKQNGVMRLIENPQAEQQGRRLGRRTVLVHLATGEAVGSYTVLERILKELGWEKYRGSVPNMELLQFHKRNSIDLISLPRDFCRFNSVYMYDLVIKNPNVFYVQDL